MARVLKWCNTFVCKDACKMHMCSSAQRSDERFFPTPIFFLMQILHLVYIVYTSSEYKYTLSAFRHWHLTEQKKKGKINFFFLINEMCRTFLLRLFFTFLLSTIL